MEPCGIKEHVEYHLQSHIELSNGTRTEHCRLQRLLANGDSAEANLGREAQSFKLQNSNGPKTDPPVQNKFKETSRK